MLRRIRAIEVCAPVDEESRRELNVESNAVILRVNRHIVLPLPSLPSLLPLSPLQCVY